MKKLMLMVIMITVQASYAQQKGIEFNTQSWTEVLAQAKKANKLIFVDVYTDWCAPCRIMDTEIFPLTAIGDTFNSSFINYKIDAEKGEGPKFSAKYAVQSYPNYLFINGDGTLIYRMGGSMRADELTLHATNAKEEAKQQTTILDMEKLYPKNQKDKDFMFNYLTRLTALKLNTTKLLDDYITLLTTSERSAPKNIQLIVDNGIWLNRKLQLGIAMNTLANNSTVFDQLKEKGLVHGESLSSIKNNAIRTSLAQAIATKDEILLQKIIDLKSDFAQNFFDNKQTVALIFLYDTHQYDRYKKMNSAYVNDYFNKIPQDTLLKQDLSVYEQMKNKIMEENNPKYNTKEYINSYKHTQSIQFCNFLTTTIENLLKISLNKTELQEVLAWSEKIVKIAATDKEFYKNAAPQYQMVYAKVLYKNGRNMDAVKEIDQLLNTFADNPRAKTVLSELLLKMKTNQDLN